MSSAQLLFVILVVTFSLNNNAFSEPTPLDGNWVLVKTDCSGEQLSGEDLIELKGESAGADPGLRQDLILEDGTFRRIMSAGLSCVMGDAARSRLPNGAMKFCDKPLKNEGTFKYYPDFGSALFEAKVVAVSVIAELRNGMGDGGLDAWQAEVQEEILILKPYGSLYMTCEKAKGVFVPPYFYYVRMGNLTS